MSKIKERQCLRCDKKMKTDENNRLCAGCKNAVALISDCMVSIDFNVSKRLREKSATE